MVLQIDYFLNMGGNYRIHPCIHKKAVKECMSVGMNHVVGIAIIVQVHATPIIAKIMYHNNVDLSRIPHLYAMVVKELTLPWVIMPADILSSNIRQNLLN